jgi:nucleoside-diphosphate-sugar epimerase
MISETFLDNDAIGIALAGSRSQGKLAPKSPQKRVEDCMERNGVISHLESGRSVSAQAASGGFPNLSAISAMDHFLVTGVTGFLGGAVVAELLMAGFSGKLLLLVRAASPAEGLERVQRSLARFQVPESQLEKLTLDNILCGDLANVSAFTGDRRLDAVTHVINSAGITSFGKDPDVWRVNVDGTLEFARRMKLVGGLKRFVHISTAMICGDQPPSVVEEDVSLTISGNHLVPYTESKAEAERRLTQEMAGLPFVIVRPTIIAGHTRLGCRPSGSIFWAFRMSHALRMTTSPLNGMIDVVPVDYAARAVLHLAAARHLKHSTYHVGSGPAHSSTFAEIDAAFVKADGGARSGEFYSGSVDDALSRKASFQDIFGQCNRRFMQMAIRLYGGFAALNATFDNSRLIKEGAPPPPKFSDYLGVCLETCQEISIYAQAMIDFV